MKTLDRILIIREITLLTKVHIVKAMIFSSNQVWIWELNHKKKAESGRIDVFELWCWRTLQDDQTSQS